MIFMTSVFNLGQIKTALKEINVLKLIEEGFIEYSKGNVIVPPVGELLFYDPPGDVHIKYGAIKNDDYYVVKIASGFGKNQELYNISPLQGLMLMFSQKTGEPVCILLDEGHLTNVRTAVAGAVVAKYLAPKEITSIGIVGTGNQAEIQLEYLESVTVCKDVVVWGRSAQKLEMFKNKFEPRGDRIFTTQDMNVLTSKCNLIVTTTSANEQLITVGQVRPGTHISAIGSDTKEKQELDPEILKKADLVIVDSISQSKERGEVYQAREAQLIDESKLVEIGTMIENAQYHRSSNQQITIADLTGVAVQDIQITKAVYQGMQKS